jgi:hypothetical protein
MIFVGDSLDIKMHFSRLSQTFFLKKEALPKKDCFCFAKKSGKGIGNIQNAFTTPNPCETPLPNPKNSGILKFTLNSPVKPIIGTPLYSTFLLRKKQRN